jgi:predicted 3-demethylubiquinone-9 3-methyltransferase (glyoxalase superfamily)
MRLAQSAAIKIVLIRADPNQQFDFDGERTFKITAEQNAEIAQLVNRFSDEVRVLVEQHWPAIERVATALLNRRIVYTDEIDAAIAG